MVDADDECVKEADAAGAFAGTRYNESATTKIANTAGSGRAGHPAPTVSVRLATTSSLICGNAETTVAACVCARIVTWALGNSGPDQRGEDGIAVEDRSTPVLYLELGDASAEACADRARGLAHLPGATRVTWWENCALGRTDLPMRVRDGNSLLVVEADDDFVPLPQPSDASEAHVFVRHPRPSQGVLTGAPTLGLLIVWISPRAPELAGALRDWGDFVHIRHIADAGIPGFTQISVYENQKGADPLFMHFYEFDTLDAEETFSTMVEHVAPRLGGTDSEAYAEWADWRVGHGRLFYCNTFRRLGEEEG
jgi:hypothetical protein